MASVTRYFRAWGKVQNVMFRQTIIRASQKRSLEAGATNIKGRKDEVEFVLSGNNKIEEIVSFLRQGKEMNNWGAKVEKLIEEESGLNLNSYQVTTHNVDQRNWNPNVEFYI